MINILIVEDEAAKRQALSKACLEVAGVKDEGIIFADDVIRAKRAMQKQTFDLVILDINLPKRSDYSALKDGGLEILRWLKTQGMRHCPQHVIALSAYDESLAVAIPEFEKSHWTLIPFSYTESAWVDKIKNTLKHLLDTLTPPFRNDGVSYRCDLGIVVALEKPELESILALPANWKRQFVPNDETVYHSGTFLIEDRSFTVVAVAADNKGMTFGAVAATKLISAFRPRYLAMAGICAGLKGRVKIGDVIFADPCWDWGSGKVKIRGGKEYFHVAPYQLRLARNLHNKIGALANDTTWLQSLKSNWTGKQPRHEIKIKLGAVASGASVLQSSKAMERVLNQHKDLHALDMEIFSILCAAEHSTIPKPIAFALKSVCDFGNERKSDGYQDYSAYVCANALYRFIAELLKAEPEIFTA